MAAHIPGALRAPGFVGSFPGLKALGLTVFQLYLAGHHSMIDGRRIVISATDFEICEWAVPGCTWWVRRYICSRKDWRGFGSLEVAVAGKVMSDYP